jgi:hypothetical protein
MVDEPALAPATAPQSEQFRVQERQGRDILGVVVITAANRSGEAPAW